MKHKLNYIDVITYPINESFEVNLFPSPMNSKSILSFSKPKESEFKLVIFSSIGEKIRSEKVSKVSVSYNLYKESLPSGIYFVNLIKDKKKYIKKLIIS